MSIEVSNRVWDAEYLQYGEKIVALCLADHADKYGYCYPSQVRIAARCGLSERHVSRVLQSLEASGDIYTGRRGRGHAYLVCIGLSQNEIETGLVKRFHMPEIQARAAARRIERLTAIPDTLSGVSRTDQQRTLTPCRVYPDTLSGADLTRERLDQTSCTENPDIVSTESSLTNSEPSDDPSEEPTAVVFSGETENPSETLQERWERILQDLKGSMLPATFNQHLLGSVALGPNGDPHRWRVRVRNLSSPDWLNQGSLGAKVARVAARELGPDVVLDFIN